MSLFHENALDRLHALVHEHYDLAVFESTCLMTWWEQVLEYL